MAICMSPVPWANIVPPNIWCSLRNTGCNLFYATYFFNATNFTNRTSLNYMMYFLYLDEIFSPKFRFTKHDAGLSESLSCQVNNFMQHCNLLQNEDRKQINRYSTLKNIQIVKTSRLRQISNQREEQLNTMEYKVLSALLLVAVLVAGELTLNRWLGVVVVGPDTL